MQQPRSPEHGEPKKREYRPLLPGFLDQQLPAKLRNQIPVTGSGNGARRFAAAREQVVTPESRATHPMIRSALSRATSKSKPRVRLSSHSGALGRETDQSPSSAGQRPFLIGFAGTNTRAGTK